MNVGSSTPFASRSLRTQAAVPGSATSKAMESLVPGDHFQVESDLAAFPQPTLDLLSRYGIRVAILEEGKTLADADGLRTLSPEENREESLRAGTLVAAGVAREFAEGVESYTELENAADDITRELRLAGLDHQMGIALSPFSLEDLAEARQIPKESRDSWKASFTELNADLVTSSDDGVLALHGLIVLPHTYRDGDAVPEIRLRNAKEVTSEYVKGSLGLNRSDERMVLLHENFLAQPAPELGNYRLATHEMGHALDYALENLESFPGFGQAHRDAVDALYAADKEKLAALGASANTEDVFTSDRADDDVREYFAEAVEAYLTPAKGDAFETFRSGNSREGLLEKNPALFGYIETVLNTNFPETAIPKAPLRQLVPVGVPDPDLEVIRVS